MDPLESILLGGPDKHTYVSFFLVGEEKEQLRPALLCNIDVFTWTHSNMTGISPVHASHRLNVVPSARLITQRVRRFHPDRQQVIQAEVDNLLKVGFIREIKYPEWMANVVVVPKKGGKWRVCVDYTDLNDASSKDNFPLPLIDQIVNASAGHGMLSFLDAFLGYHQIPMYMSDAEKITFITPHGILCYNVWVKELLGKTMKVYIDDMLVKSKQHLDHVTHLQEAFELLKAYDMKLNPSKCAFEVSAG